jgi:hypothetical protein
MEMKTYKVWARDIAYHYAFVEAADEDEALDKALEMDGSEFIHSNKIDWQIDTVEEVTNE